MTIQLEVGKVYLNHLGEKVTIISRDNHKDYPFNSEFSSFTPDGYWCLGEYSDKNLVKEYENYNSSKMDINDLVNDLLNGVTYYTSKGDKVYMKDNMLWFNKSGLDLNKIIKVDLFTSAPKVNHPCIGKVCEVWDNDRNESQPTYTLITEYIEDSTSPFVTVRGYSWKHAKVLVQP